MIYSPYYGNTTHRISAIASRLPISAPPIPRPVKHTKSVILDEKNISLLQLTDADIRMLTGNYVEMPKIKSFLPGSIYALSCESVEGLNFDKLYFKVYAHVKDYHGVNINSIVVREVHMAEDGSFFEDDTISNGRRKFSLPPSICKEVGLEYKPGYEIWSVENNRFEYVNVNANSKRKEIDYDDLSTYPANEAEGGIRYMLVKLDGFRPFNEDSILTPNNEKLSTDEFLNSLSFTIKQNISTDDGCAGFDAGEKLFFKIVSRKTASNQISICSPGHCLIAKVYFLKQSLNVRTENGDIGVSPKALEGKTINDIIEVKWEEEDKSVATNNYSHEYRKKVDISEKYPHTSRLFNLMDDIQHRIDRINSTTDAINEMLQEENKKRLRRILLI